MKQETIHTRHCKYRCCKYGEEEICKVYLGLQEASNDKLENKPSEKEFIKRRERARQTFIMNDY